MREQNLCPQNPQFLHHSSWSGKFHGVIKNCSLLEKFSVLAVEEGGDTWCCSNEGAKQAEGEPTPFFSLGTQSNISPSLPSVYVSLNCPFMAAIYHAQDIVSGKRPLDMSHGFIHVTPKHRAGYAAPQTPVWLFLK